MRHLALAVAVLAAAAPSVHGQSPTVQTIQIGTPEPASTFEAIAINASGVVVGTIGRESQTAARNAVYTWTRSGGFRFAVDNATARDINDGGIVVGSWGFCDPWCPPRGFLWSPTTGVRDLGAMNPVAINNRQEMAGWCRDVDAACVRSGSTTRRLPDGFSPFDINDRGIVAGLYRPGNEGRAAIWGAALGLRVLDQMPGGSAAYAINEHGLVVGEGSVPVTSPQGFREQAAVWTPVGRAGDTHFNSYAWGLSNRGWVVGQAEGHPALWLLGGRLVKLPTGQVPPNSGHGAFDVNDAGQIVGRVLVSNTESRSVLWIVR